MPYTFKTDKNIVGERTLIINGVRAVEGRYPYAQISLQLQKSGQTSSSHQCGGSLVAPDIVLTAAHCHSFYSEIQLGRYNLSDDSSAFQTIVINDNDVHIHPLFDSDTFRYDFSLVRLSTAVKNMSLVKLNGGGDVPIIGSNLTVVGFGATDISDPTARIFPDTLMEGTVNYYTNDWCKSFYYAGEDLYLNDIFPEMLCAYRAGVDACRGDSGSPLLVKGSGPEDDIQVGLVSWGRGCAVYPGVYSRISSAYEWIRWQICNLSIEPPAYFKCEASWQTIQANDEVSTLSPSTSPKLNENPSAIFPTSSALNNQLDSSANGFSRIEPSAINSRTSKSAFMMISLYFLAIQI